MRSRLCLIVSVAAILLAGCGGQQGDGSVTPKEFPEPTPSCVGCDVPGYHCGTSGGEPACVPD